MRAHGGHFKPWSIHASCLRDAHKHRLASNDQNAPVSLAVPEIDFVLRPATERPRGQIEPERRCRIEGERDAAQALTSTRAVTRTTRREYVRVITASNPLRKIGEPREPFGSHSPTHCHTSS